jgi:hypothetical protein
MKTPELVKALEEGRKQQVIALRMTTAIMNGLCAAYPDLKAIEQAALKLRQRIDSSILDANALIARLKAEPEPVVLAEGWAAKGNPFKVRTPKGEPSDVPVAIVAREP